MAVAQEADPDFWKQFEGSSLLGQFPLHGYLGSSATGGLFVSQVAGQEDPVLVKLVRQGAAGWERLSAGWTLAKQLNHVNLIRVHATGLADLDGLRIAYAVTEYPDATLTNILEERRLSAEEGQTLLRDCSEALQYLHKRGVVHTGVEPGAIVSVNETIKLSIDRLRRAGDQDAAREDPGPCTAPEVASAGYSPAGDVWSLGATIDAAAPEAPYSDLLRHCLATDPADRWTASQIVAALKGSSPEQPKSNAKVATIKYAIPAAFILLLGFMWLANREGSPLPKAPPIVHAIPKPAEAADVDRLKDAPLAETPKPSAFDGAGAKSWLVVVYTYSRPGDAEHKAAEINGKWSGFDAHVLAMKSGSPHLVVLGNGMTRDAALKLRYRALASGLPRDSYVQNF